MACWARRSAMREIEEALRIAERSGDDVALAFARGTLGLALVHRHTAAERDRGHEAPGRDRRRVRPPGTVLGELPLVNASVARERARRGDRDGAYRYARRRRPSVPAGHCWLWGVPATGVLVETLLDRGAVGDVAEADAAIERLAAAPADDGLAVRDIWLLRLRALLARAHGDDGAHRHLGSLSRYGGIVWLRRTHRLGNGDDHGRGTVNKLTTPRTRRPYAATGVPVLRSASSVHTWWHLGSYRCKGRRSIGIA